MPQLYQKGTSGNPRGASSLTMLRTHENARKAVALREKMLDTLASRIATIEVMVAREFGEQGADKVREMTDIRIMALLTPDVNRLITDSESRGLGAPKQQLDIDANLVDRRRPEEFSDEELAQIIEGSATRVGVEEMTMMSRRMLGSSGTDDT